MRTASGEIISKKEALVREAIACGFQRFEAEALHNCLQRFADRVETNFMDKLIAHPSICRQIIDAGLLASDPGGLRQRGTNK